MAVSAWCRQPIRIRVEAATRPRSRVGEEAARLRALLERTARTAATSPSSGSGQRPGATDGVILEDEKVMGTIHIAFGDHKSMAAPCAVASHLDGLVKSPSVWLDDRQIMRGGTLLVE